MTSGRINECIRFCAVAMAMTACAPMAELDEDTREPIEGVLSDHADDQPPPAAEADADSDDEIAVTQQALGTPVVYAHGRRHFAGNISAENHYVTVSRAGLLAPYGSVTTAGEPCARGYVRVERPVVRWTSGNGGCAFKRWVNPTNRADCRAVLHVWTNAFWGSGFCEWTVKEQRL
jgi:hypothetical protein